MNLMLLGTFCLLLLTYKVIGVNIWSICATVSCLLFAGRKIGYLCKINRLIVYEVAGALVYIIFKLMTKDVHAVLWIITAVIRAAHIGIMYYDKIAYVYVKEERRRESK